MGSNLPAELRAAVWDGSGGACHYCGAELHPLRTFTVDHMVPRSKGGGDDLGNLVAACRSCNSAKGGAPAIGQRTPPPPIALLVTSTQVVDLARRLGGQSELARRLGVSRQRVSTWATGRHVPAGYYARELRRLMAGAPPTEGKRR